MSMGELPDPRYVCCRVVEDLDRQGWLRKGGKRHPLRAGPREPMSTLRRGKAIPTQRAGIHEGSGGPRAGGKSHPSRADQEREGLNVGGDA